MPAPSKALSRSEREKRRYATVYNATGDRALARTARGWSDQKILSEIGARVPKTVTPKVRKLTAEEIRRKQREYDKYRYARIEIGLQPSEAIPLKKYKRTKIASTQEYITALYYLDEYGADTSQTERAALWNKWAKEDSLPPAIRTLARKLNLAEQKKRAATDQRYQTAMKKDGDYGYTLAYHLFVSKISLESLEETFTPDPWSSERVYYRDIARAHYKGRPA